MLYQTELRIRTTHTSPATRTNPTQSAVSSLPGGASGIEPEFNTVMESNTRMSARISRGNDNAPGSTGEPGALRTWDKPLSSVHLAATDIERLPHPF